MDSYTATTHFVHFVFAIPTPRDINLFISIDTLFISQLRSIQQYSTFLFYKTATNLYFFTLFVKREIKTIA